MSNKDDQSWHIGLGAFYDGDNKDLLKNTWEYSMFFVSSVQIRSDGVRRIPKNKNFVRIIIEMFVTLNIGLYINGLSK